MRLAALSLFVGLMFLSSLACSSDSLTTSTPRQETPLPSGTVSEQLTILWARSDWDSIIKLLEAEQRKSPLDDDMRQTLYAARVNAGYAALAGR